MAGLANMAKNVKGAQIAGLLNISGNVQGFQIARLANVSHKANGVQIAGLINIADSSNYPVAVVNLIKNGYKKLALNTDETGSITLSLRSGGQVTYGIAGAGYDLSPGKNTFVTEAGLGFRTSITPEFSLSQEAKCSTYFGSKASFKAGYYFLPTISLTSDLELVGGASINYAQTNDLHLMSSFPVKTFWNKRNEQLMKQVYMGYLLGLQIVL